VRAIARIGRPWSPSSLGSVIPLTGVLDPYRVRPLRHDRVEVWAAVRDRDATPMLNFDERHLLAAAERTGFDLVSHPDTGASPTGGPAPVGSA
jgi:hypothetical protein